MLGSQVSAQVEVDDINADSVREVVDAPGKTRPLIIGVALAPPFVMKSGNTYTGLSVELWNNIARQNQWEFTWKEFELQDLLKALEKGEVDICINPLTVTSKRLQRFNFSQPYFITSLAIAVKGEESYYFLRLILNFFSLDFLKVLGLLLSILLVFGLIVWLAERHHNPDQFGKGWKGIGDGIWWSAVTMTTVGYGDKAPVTWIGKIVGFIWMFTAIIVITSFTAGITSSLTVNQMDNVIEGLKDLKDMEVGSIEGTSSAEVLLHHGIPHKYYQNLKEGMDQLIEGSVSAFVYDEPMLQYIIKEEGLEDKVQVLNHSFHTEYYSFSMPYDHPLITPLNQALITQLESPGWRQILHHYHLNNEDN